MKTLTIYSLRGGIKTKVFTCIHGKSEQIALSISAAFNGAVNPVNLDKAYDYEIESIAGHIEHHIYIPKLSGKAYLQLIRRVLKQKPRRPEIWGYRLAMMEYEQKTTRCKQIGFIYMLCAHRGLAEIRARHYGEQNQDPDCSLMFADPQRFHCEEPEAIIDLFYWTQIIHNSKPIDEFKICNAWD